MATGLPVTFSTARMISRTLKPRPVPRFRCIGLPGLEFFHGEDVRIGQIFDMDVVAHVGAIGRRIVGAEKLELLPAFPWRPGG